ncbi:MAG: hypothetical protein K2R93_15295 [Gemmatimonadaceae bacterium]|nr:hypothetical protein [Gemmatimonadaceae bacterium]
MVIALAPTADRQARGILAREVEKWARIGGIDLRRDGYTLNHDANSARLVMLSGMADVGNIEGLHAPAVLLIADEAKSLTVETLDALAGALTGDEARTLMASTPGAAVGAFYDACSDDTGTWVAHHIGAPDSSNVNPKWVQRQAAKWGTSSPSYITRVLGEFVLDGSGQLFPWGLLHASQAWEPVVPPSRHRYRQTTMGVDVARSIAGDASAVVVVKDGRVIHRETWREADSMITTQRVVALVAQFSPQSIRVDASGPGGGVVDRLRQLRYPVEAVYFGGRASEPERLANWRAEAYHTLRSRLDDRSLALPADDRLCEELAALTVLFDRTGRLQLVSKDEVRAKLGRSPDLADALALAVAVGDPNLASLAPVRLSVGPATYFSLSHPSLNRPDGLVPSGDPVLRMQERWRGRQAS